ncbi:MAG: hypothetical protein AAGD25_01685 [Cyanobacteria bacterium P01_F01_bin.150]
MWSVCKTASELGIKPDGTVLPVNLKTLPPHKNRQSTFITYQTAIAIKLSHRWNKPLDDVVELIDRYLQELINGNLDEQTAKFTSVTLSSQAKMIYRTLTFCRTTVGYIQLCVRSDTLMTWLRALQRTLAEDHIADEYRSNLQGLGEKPEITYGHWSARPLICPPCHISLNNIPFSILHAYARACSILRLANSMGQIQLRSLHPNSRPMSAAMTNTVTPNILYPPFVIDYPKELPWQALLLVLQNRETSQTEKYSDKAGQSRTDQSKIANDLILETLLNIITTLDLAFGSHIAEYRQNLDAKKRLKAIVDLGTAFHLFDNEFNVCGIHSRHRSHLSHLYLIFIIQRILHDLLLHTFEGARLWLETLNQYY